MTLPLRAEKLLGASPEDLSNHLIANAPYISEELVTELTVTKWNPGFGALSQYAG